MSGAKRKLLRKQEPVKEATYTLKQSDIDRIKKDATDDAVGKALILMLGLPCMALRDKFGFGKIRLERFTDETLDLFDSFNKGYITFEDCLNCLQEETGISIAEKAKQHRVV